MPVANLVTIAAPMNDLEGGATITNLKLAVDPHGAGNMLHQFINSFKRQLVIYRQICGGWNIAGDLLIGGRHDGEVAINSSLVIRYLVKDRTKDYTEVDPRSGLHSLLP